MADHKNERPSDLAIGAILTSDFAADLLQYSGVKYSMPVLIVDSEK